MFKWLKLLNLTMYFADDMGGGSDGGSDGDSGADGGADGGDTGDSGAGDAGGTGDAPGADAGASGADGGDLILGKFKDQDALAEGYTNLQKKLGNFQGTPKDGYAPIEGLENTTADQNRLMAVLQEVGKDAQMDQGTYESLYTQITEMQARVADETLQATIKEIPNYDTRAKAMADTALRFLRPDQADAVDALMQSKESFEAVEILMGQLRGGSLPNNPGVTETSQEELRAQIKNLNPADSAGRKRLLEQLNAKGDGQGRLV